MELSFRSLVFIWLVLACDLNCVIADEFSRLQAEDESRQLVDDWVERLEAVEPQQVDRELAVMAQADGGNPDSVWRTIAMARLIHDGTHVETAASYLLDQVHSYEDHPRVSLNQRLMNDLVPVLLDRLESQVSPVFEAGTEWVPRFHSIHTEHSARIRDLVWNWTDHPYRQVEGCRLLARLDVATNDDRQAIIACLESPDNIVVTSALQSAAAMNSPELLPSMQKHLNHISDAVAIEAAASILLLIEQQPDSPGSQEATSAAVAVLRKQYFDDRRSDVIRAVEKFGRHMLLVPDVLRDAIASPAEIHSGGFFSFDTGMHVSASAVIVRCGEDSLPLIRAWLSDPETPILVRIRLLASLWSINADQSSIRPIVERQLQYEDDHLRHVAFKLLAKYGNVDVRLMEPVVPVEAEQKHQWIKTLGSASASSRDVAIRLLEPYVLEGTLDNRIAAASSLLALGHHSSAIDNLPGALIPDLDEVGWEELPVLMDVTKQVRPSPAGLAEQLLAAAMSRKEVEPDETDQPDEMVVSSNDYSHSIRCADLLGGLDDSAFDARIQLLQHPDGNVRQLVLLQLGENGDPRALFPIVSHLFDHTTYWVSVSNDMHYTVDVRKAAIEALANPEMDVTPIVPMLCDLLSEDWAAVDAARALSHCKMQSETILARLYALELDEVNERSLAIAATAAKLEKDESKRLKRMKSQLELLRSPAHAVIGSSHPFLSTPPLLATLLELHDDGISLESLREELNYLAIEQPLLGFDARAEIVTVLAVINPNDPRWMKMLNQWKSEEKYSFGTADQLLDQLLLRSSPLLEGGR